MQTADTRVPARRGAGRGRLRLRPGDGGGAVAQDPRHGLRAQRHARPGQPAGGQKSAGGSRQFSRGGQVVPQRRGHRRSGARRSFSRCRRPRATRICWSLAVRRARASSIRICRNCCRRFCARSRDSRFCTRAGRATPTATEAAYAATGADPSRWQVSPFLDDMPARFARAHLVMSRSGASTVAELAAAGKPALLVPFAAAADEHQRRNAEAMVAAGAAVMLHEKDLEIPEKLLAALTGLLTTPARLAAMAAAARTQAHPGAAERIAARSCWWQAGLGAASEQVDRRSSELASSRGLASELASGRLAQRAGKAELHRQKTARERKFAANKKPACRSRRAFCQQTSGFTGVRRHHLAAAATATVEAAAAAATAGSRRHHRR